MLLYWLRYGRERLCGLARAGLLLCIPLCGAPARALEAGDHEVAVSAAASARRYIVHVPQKPAPLPALILNLHGGGGEARGHQRYVQMDALAEREGFLVAYPYGSGGFGGRFLTWNAGSCCGPSARNDIDDLGFLRDLLDDLRKRIPYDRARVYATGLSNGAMMSYRLAAEMPERIAAIAPVAGSMVLPAFNPNNPNNANNPARPVPVMHVHSVDDTRALYAGGLAPAFPGTNTQTLHPPVEAQLAKWAQANGCKGTPVASEEKEWRGASGALHSATRLAYQGCLAETSLWKLTGPGHVWPGGRLDYLPALLGPGTQVIDVNEEMWRFFARHRLPGAN